MTTADNARKLADIFGETVALKNGGKNALERHLADPGRRLDYTLKRLSFCLESKKCTDVRAFSAAGRVLGRRTGVPGVKLRTAIRAGAPMLDMIATEMPTRALGSVYFIAEGNDSGLIKIGFTTNFEQRFAALGSQYFMIAQIGVFPGTLLDELTLHCANHSSRQVGEWFDRPANVYPGVPERYAAHLAHLADFREWRQSRRVA